MTIKSTVRNIFAVAMCVVAVAASANQLRVMSLEEKVAKSEIVLIGAVKATATETHGVNDRYLTKYALVDVTQTLKGTPGRTIRVQFQGPIAEENPDCCLVGKSYLFFLKKSNDSVYVSVNHSFGIYSIPDAK